jgi:hypothetical protein
MNDYRVIYHVLSVENLAKKHEWAKEHCGSLLLTSSISKLLPHIYCLPNLIGGTLFAFNKDSRAIRIDLKESVKIFKYIGRRKDFTIEKHNELAKRFDLIHCVYEDPGLLWQELFLVNGRAIERWTDNLEIIQTDFNEQYDKLKKGLISSDDFFYMEMPQEKQLLAAEVIGLHIGLKINMTHEKRYIHEDYDKACYRLGVLKSTITKKLFFCTTHFIDLVKKISMIKLNKKKDIFSGINFLYLEHETTWDEFDSVVSEASIKISELISLNDIKPIESLTIAYENPDFSNFQSNIKFKVGIFAKEHNFDTGLETEAIETSFRFKQEHRGNFTALEDSYSKLFKSSDNNKPQRVFEFFHIFQGARSNSNVIELAML